MAKTNQVVDPLATIPAEDMRQLIREELSKIEDAKEAAEIHAAASAATVRNLAAAEDLANNMLRGLDAFITRPSRSVS